MAVCAECCESYNDKRKQLGYKTCLECGDLEAAEEILRKSKCVAPAYNKGAYMYITNTNDALDVGK